MQCPMRVKIPGTRSDPVTVYSTYCRLSNCNHHVAHLKYILFRGDKASYEELTTKNCKKSRSQLFRYLLVDQVWPARHKSVMIKYIVLLFIRV